MCYLTQLSLHRILLKSLNEKYFSRVEAVIRWMGRFFFFFLNDIAFQGSSTREKVTTCYVYREESNGNRLNWSMNLSSFESKACSTNNSINPSSAIQPLDHYDPTLFFYQKCYNNFWKYNEASYFIFIQMKNCNILHLW